MLLGLVVSFVVTMALVLMLCMRRNVMNINDLVGGGAPSAAGAEQPAESEPAEGKHPEKVSTPTPISGAAPAEDADKKRPTQDPLLRTPDISIGVQVGGELPLPEETLPGLTHFREVTLPENALDWSKPMQEPELGSCIEVTVLADHVYRFEVKSVDIYENPRKVTVMGPLVGASGNAQMMLLEGRMLLQIRDNTLQKVFNLYFAADRNTYLMQELDTSALPPQIPFDFDDADM